MTRSTLICVLFALLCAPGSLVAQTRGADPDDPAPFGPPVMDRHVWMHGILDQLEARSHSGSNSLQWEGEAWIGGDTHRLVLKSEGSAAGGEVEEGIHEAFYTRPVGTYFDAQVGLRYDRDTGPSRTWLALGIEGMAPQWLDVEATAYVRDGGDVAARLRASTEILLTQRLIVEPDVELNFYGQSDPKRGIGSGLSDLDAGIRLRYELHRKLAPYVGIAYERTFNRTASLARRDGEREKTWSVVVGLRAWF